MPKRRGQTILELVIASGVIMTSVVATTTLVISTISSGRVSQSNIEAANFAREGVEAIRSIRDTNWIKAYRNISDCDVDGCNDESNDAVVTKWDDRGFGTIPGYYPLAPTSGAERNYRITRVNGGPAVTLGGINPTVIRWHPDGYFVQDPCGGCTENTKYYRIIKITLENECFRDCSGSGKLSANRLRIISTVVWRDRTGSSTSYPSIGNREVTAEGYLYEWR